MNNDLISKAELFNKLAVIKAPPEANKYKGEVYSVIQAMETADDGWIPCNEKMPEDGQAVIICTDDKRFKDHPVGTCIYEHGRFRTTFHHDISMIAWMPLPQPYRKAAEKGCDSK